MVERTGRGNSFQEWEEEYRVLAGGVAQVIGLPWCLTARWEALEGSGTLWKGVGQGKGGAVNGLSLRLALTTASL